MTLEEQLTRAFDTLTERLRGEIDRQLQQTAAEVTAAAASHSERTAADAQSSADAMAAAVAAAREEALEAGRAAGHEAGRAAGHEAGHEAGYQAARLEAEHEAVARAAEEAARQSTAAPSAMAGTADSERLTDAIRVIEGARSLTEILDALVSGASDDALRADVWLLRGGSLHQWRGIESNGAAASPSLGLSDDTLAATAARTNSSTCSAGEIAVPIALAGTVVAVLNAELGTGNSELRIHNVEFLTRYAARCLEAMTAFTVARALTGPPASPGAGGLSSGGDAEDDTSARRYARLLVSEIKLYHEAAVVEGRRDRDLATRLGGEIARARVMYEQRVPPHVRDRARHFHDELVRTLANGDASLLEVRS